MQEFRWNLLLIVALVGALAPMARAQFPTDTRVNTNVQQNDSRVNTQVNTQVITQVGGLQYSRDVAYNANGTIRYGTQVGMLPSEIRYATERSGATPSELRARRNALGPGLPDPRGYIPGPTPLQQLMRTPTVELYNPANTPGPPPALAPNAPPLPQQTQVPAPSSPPNPNPPPAGAGGPIVPGPANYPQLVEAQTQSVAIYHYHTKAVPAESQTMDLPPNVGTIRYHDPGK